MHNAVTIHTNNAEETRRIGRIIGENASPGDVYLLTGPLGAGKTCLTQGIAQGLGVDGHARSPTFVLLTRYRGRLTLQHADLYRINHPAEAWDLGLEDIVAPAMTSSSSNGPTVPRRSFRRMLCGYRWTTRSKRIRPPVKSSPRRMGRSPLSTASPSTMRLTGSRR